MTKSNRTSTAKMADRRTFPSRISGKTRSSGVGTDVARVKCSAFSTILTGGDSVGSFKIFPTNPEVVTPSTVSIAQNFAYYRPISVEVEWIPTTGTDTAGFFHHAFVTTSQAMLAATDTTNLADLLRNEAGSQIDSTVLPFKRKLDISRLIVKKWFEIGGINPGGITLPDASYIGQCGTFIYKTVMTSSGYLVFHTTFELRQRSHGSTL